MLLTVFLIKNLALQFLALFGCWAAAAAGLSYLSRAMNSAFQNCAFPDLGLYLFGWIGIPVHEFSHAVFCKIFGHEIAHVKWFDPRGEGGAHGAVTHRYSRWNLYHRLGHFFIGLAPAILGPVLIGILLYWLVPTTRGLVHGPFAWHSTASWLAELARAIVNRGTLTSIRFYVFLYLAICIASQIELSEADIQQALLGLLPVLFVLLIINFVWALALNNWHLPQIASFQNVETHFMGLTTQVRSFLFSSLIFALVISSLTYVVCAVLFGAFGMVAPRKTSD